MDTDNVVLPRTNDPAELAMVWPFTTRAGGTVVVVPPVGRGRTGVLPAMTEDWRDCCTVFVEA